MTDPGSSSTGDGRHRGQFGRAWRVGAFILLLGPPIGSLPISSVWIARDIVAGSTGGGFEALTDTALLILLGGFFSYFMGGVPALVAALWLARKTYRDGGFSYVQAALTALVSAAVVLLPEMGSLSAESLRFYAMVSFLSLFSALVCRFALGRLGWFGGAPDQSGRSATRCRPVPW